MLRKTPIHTKGFSLVELLIASVLLAIGSVVFLQTYLSISALNEANRNASVATVHAQFVMEDIRSKNISSTGFNSIPSGINNGDWNWDTTKISAKGIQPLISEAIVTTYTTPTTGLLKVTVTLNWKDRFGRNRSAFLETFFSRPP